MDVQIFFKCILCKKLGINFQCERCNETYCSKDCQIIHWPVHRKMCFPMPELIPLKNLTMSFNAPLNNDQYSSVVKYYPKKWFNAKKSFYRKQNQTTISYKSRFSGYLSPEQSSNSFSICSVSNFTQSILEPIDEPKKWSEDFVFGVITEVVVQHFSENPTSTCWVILQSDVERRDAIVNNISSHHSFDEIHFDEIKLSKLYSVKFEGGWYRGMVLHIINSTYVWVRLIDNGRCFRAHINALRKLYNVATDLKGLAFEINFEPSRNIRIGEVLRVENISHNADEIIGVRFVEDEKIFTDQNIESTPLPVDVATELFCLDCTNIDKGYISACEYDRKKVQTVDEISDKISKYVKGNDGDKKYCPKLKELCLAYVDDDGLWYRTKCVENVLLNVFRLEKIDYGSTVDVTSENIRKMVEDFLQPSVIMHQCAILGVPPEPDELATKKIMAYFKRNPIFCIKRATISDGKYTVHIPDLLKLIQ